MEKSSFMARALAKIGVGLATELPAEATVPSIDPRTLLVDAPQAVGGPARKRTRMRSKRSYGASLNDETTPIHKCMTLKKAHGPGSYVEHDRRVRERLNKQHS